MTEQDWLISKEPQAMLKWVNDYGASVGPTVGATGTRYPAKPSDRKLWLWVEACREACGPRLGRDWRPLDEVSSMRVILEFWSGGTTPLPKATRAALLREVVGNPCRPVIIGKADQQVKDERVCEKCGERFSSHPGRCTSCGSEFIRKWRWQDETPWAFTPTVLTLAQAAYDERPGRISYLRPPDLHPDEESYKPRHIDDGTLDPFRLAMLADELEYVGCTDKAILSHLRSLPCHTCHGSGIQILPDRHPPSRICPDCGGSRSAGLHVRGCWVLDLILGRN